MLRCQQPPHAPGIAHDSCPDLEQLDAEGSGAGVCERRAMQRETAQIDHEGVGQRGQQQA